jgi:hypothetical protein
MTAHDPATPPPYRSEGADESSHPVGADREQQGWQPRTGFGADQQAIEENEKLALRGSSSGVLALASGGIPARILGTA